MSFLCLIKWQIGISLFTIMVFIHCRVVWFFYLCIRKQFKHIHYETNLYFPYNVHVGIDAGNDDKLRY